MQLIDRKFTRQPGYWLMLCLFCVNPLLMALESDRQEPLEVNANSTDGTLGDGITTLRGNVDIRQGTLHITANEAEINKVEGRVKTVTFRGQPAFLEQQIEEQGRVQATASVIEYQVASGLVTLKGNADVKHPQYQISGDLLIYDLNIQHFQGSGGDNGNGRIYIQLEPEVIKKDKIKAGNDKENRPAAEDSPILSPDPGNSNKDGTGALLD